MTIATPADEQTLREKTQASIKAVESVRLKTKFTVTDSRINKFGKPDKVLTTNRFNASKHAFVWDYHGESSTDGTGPFSIVTAANRDYWFVVEKFSGQNWSMKKLDVNSLQPFEDAVDEAVELKKLIVPDAMIFILPWESIIAEPTFKITRWEESGPLATIEYTTDSPKRNGPRVLKGKTVINSENFLIDHYEATLEYQSKETGYFVGHTAYQEPIDNTPIPQLSEYKQTESPGGEFLNSVTLTYEKVTRGDLGSSEPWLSACGLPEPTLPSRPGIPPWQIFLAIGVVLLIGSVFLKRRMAKEAS